MNEPLSENREVVCIGASWGGLDALRVLLGRVPADVAAPICVVQHRGEDDGVGMLVECLAKACALHVCEAEDKQPLTPGTVYVAPAGYHMLVNEAHVALSVEDRVRCSRPSVDVLFESAASAHGPHVTAVVLTGANDDGARGARAVRDAGGVVLVQDPDTAERREMPQAALDAVPDAPTMTLGELADELVRHVGAVEGRRG